MKKGIIISLLVIGIVATCTWLLLRWANSPVKQRVISTDIANSTKASETIAVTTDYYTTELPTGYRVETQPNPSDPTMIQLSAFPSDDRQVQVGITTALLPTGGLEGVADYLYRMRQSDVYTPTDSKVFVDTEYSFRKAGGGELSTFITHSGRYASIAVSGEGTSQDDLESVRQLIAKNWRWL